MKTFWIIENKHIQYDDGYDIATFGEYLISCFPTRKLAREKVKELYKLDTRPGVTEIKYRVAKYVLTK